MGKPRKEDLHQSLQDELKNLIYYAGITTNISNNYSVNVPNISTLSEGVALSVKFNADSTGNSTLNINSIGAKPIKKANGTDVTNLKANGIYTLRYDGANFILQGEGASGNATASDLRSGKTASTDAGDITGTLDLTNLVPSNIRKDITIDGVDGGMNVPAFTWSQSSVGGTGKYASIDAITYGNGLFVLNNNDDGYIYTSVDGINWSQSVSQYPFQYTKSACYARGVYILAGVDTYNSLPNVITSPDGVNWTVRSTPFGANSYVTGVCYGNKIFVAVSTSKQLATSIDGASWTLRTIPSELGSVELQDVCYGYICNGESRFVVIGKGGRVATSLDGIAWNMVTLPDSPTTDLQTVCYGNGLFVVGGANGKLYTSTDGITWTSRDSQFGTSNILASCYAGLYVIVGVSGKMAVSKDGITWTPVDCKMGTTTVAACTFGNGVFLVSGRNYGKVSRSMWY